MFARRYFAARYFAPRYFPAGGGDTPPPTDRRRLGPRFIKNVGTMMGR